MKVRATHPAIGELTFQVKKQPVVVGRRGGSADIDLNWDALVSRRHARFWEEGGEVWFEDLASRNGSYLGNDRLSTPIRLAPGVKVLVGDTMFALATEPPNDFEPDTTEERPAPVIMPDGSVIEPKSYAGLPLPDLAPEEDGAKQTIDLRAPSAAALAIDAPINLPVIIEVPAPVERVQMPAGPIARQHPRFVAGDRVEVVLRERETLRTLWLEDISKGGLFVQSDTPPPRGTKVQVELTAPDGKLSFNAEVVHVVDLEMAKRIGRSAGVGLQFLDLTPDKKRAIQQYIEGVAVKLNTADLPTPVHAAARTAAPGHAVPAAHAAPANHAASAAKRTAQKPTPPPSPEAAAAAAAADARSKTDQVLDLTKKILADFEKNALYALLETEPIDPPERLHAQVIRLLRRLEQMPPGLNPAQVARVQTAHRCVERVGQLFSDPIRRLEYDFRTGNIRVAERIAESKKRNGISLVKVRETWNRVFPGNSQRANQLFHLAFEARQRRDFARAIEAGEEALKLDPFLEELKNSVLAWKEMFQEQNAR